MNQKLAAVVRWLVPILNILVAHHECPSPGLPDSQCLRSGHQAIFSRASFEGHPTPFACLLEPNDLVPDRRLLADDVRRGARPSFVFVRDIADGLETVSVGVRALDPE
jgi:hypothetical protein